MWYILTGFYLLLYFLFVRSIIDKNHFRFSLNISKGTSELYINISNYMDVPFLKD